MARYLALVFVVLAAGVGWAADVPEMRLFVGGGIVGPNFHLTLDGEGRLSIRRTGMPFVRPGKLSESSRTLSIKRSEAKALFKLAKATTDFGEGCGSASVADGVVAHLLVTNGTDTLDRTCTHGGEWPRAHTKAFLNRLNRHLPRGFRIE